MRYLVFGDVHGNLPALEKMLIQEAHNFDALVCHGDVVGYGPWSNECVELLEEINCVCLQGNHEEYFLSGVYPGSNAIAKAFFEFAFPAFSKKQIISNYSGCYHLPNFKIQHTINDAYIFPDTDMSLFQLDTNFIIGHSHYQFRKVVGSFDLINTGSVGQNRKFINRIDYLIINPEQDKINLKSIIYNVDVIISEMKRLKYPLLCIDYYKNKKRL